MFSLSLETMNIHVIILLICYLLASCYEIEGYSITKEEDIRLEKQLQFINKPSLTTRSTIYGDLYDCVDFYKQPAFDHPSLKNHTFNHQMKYKHEKRGYNFSSINGHLFKIFKDGGCPFGSVPIRRTTKADLIREKEHLSKRDGNEIDVAVTPTGGEGYSTGPFTGAGMILGIYKPSVSGSQYSAVRMRIQNGDDAIQIGWRVDPSLYGDDKIRLYIYFKAGQIECFNTRCPGFIYVNTEYPLDYVFNNYYKIGEKNSHEVELYLVRDNVGNWWLEVGSDNIQLGFWPARIFNGLNNLATYIDWGAEVRNTKGTEYVDMGLGSLPKKDPFTTAYCRVISVLTPDGKTSDAVTGESYTTHNDKYDIWNINYADDYYRHAIFYGGPHHNSD